MDTFFTGRNQKIKYDIPIGPQVVHEAFDESDVAHDGRCVQVRLGQEHVKVHGKVGHSLVPHPQGLHLLWESIL